MAKRKKQTPVRKGKSKARGKARKASKSVRGKAANRIVAKAIPKKGVAKAKRGGAKKVRRKKVRQMKRPVTPLIETTIVDVIEEPAPGVITVTEFEEAEVREPGGDFEPPDES